MPASLDQIGPITRSVADASLILSAISGKDRRDTTSLNAPVPDFSAGLDSGIKGLRIGVPKEYFIDGIDPAVDTAVRAAIEHCKSLGADVREVSLPHTDYAIATYYIIATAEASSNLARFDGVRYGLRVDGADPLDQYRKVSCCRFRHGSKATHHAWHLCF